jgi:Uma2 family endonuclease
MKLAGRGGVMSKMLVQDAETSLTIHLGSFMNLTNDCLYEFCQLNPELRIERTAQGDLLIMPPTGGETSRRNVDLVIAVGTWARQDGSGVVFDSSGGFMLPNSALRSPDVAWVRRSRLERLTTEEKRKFIPLCPDFVIELRSPTDRLAALQAKMQEYIDNGAQLGWLIDPEDRRLYVYRPESPTECLEHPAEISGDPVLPGFVLDLRDMWETGF